MVPAGNNMRRHDCVQDNGHFFVDSAITESARKPTIVTRLIVDPLLYRLPCYAEHRQMRYVDSVGTDTALHIASVAVAESLSDVEGEA